MRQFVLATLCIAFAVAMFAGLGSAAHGPNVAYQAPTP